MCIKIVPQGSYKIYYNILPHLYKIYIITYIIKSSQQYNKYDEALYILICNIKY